MVKAVGRIGSVFLALVASGCGGTADDEAASCGDTSECGGDIVGQWKITSSCLDLAGTDVSESMNCPGLTSEAKEVGMSGTVAYNRDLTFQANVTMTGSLAVNVPAACLTQGAITLTCEQLRQSLAASAADNGFESVSCSGSSGCSCTLKLIPQVQTTSGTYSTAGGKVTQLEAGGTPDQNSYCVKGSTLTLSPEGAMSPISGSVVLSKQ